MTAETKETKRARRKLGAHPSQLWPQMPKIQSATARANAYLKVAGLSTKIAAPPLDPQLDLMNAPEIKFGRLLASTEQRVRHEAVRRLHEYLKARCALNNEEGVGLSEMDLLKLWKGLWFTLYMADRVPVQDELSKQLAQMIWCVAGTEEEDEYAAKTYLDMYGADDDEDDDDDPEVIMQEIVNTTGHVYNDDDDDDDDDDDEEDPDDHDHDENGACIKGEDVDASLIPHCRGAHLAALFIKTFFQTVRREWGRMDKYRVDKFYTLIRLMMEQVYEYMAKRHWNLGIVRLFNDIVCDEVLMQTPNGLRLHLVDLSLDELAKVNARAPMPLTEATFVDVLEPYFALAQACKDKIVQARIMDKVLRGFLEKYSVISEAALAETDEENFVMTEVHVGTVADFIFSLGSDSDTRNEYREALYATYKDYKRRLKHVGRDVVLDLNEENAGNDDAEEMDDGEEARVIEVDDPITYVDDALVKEEPPTKKSRSKGNKQSKGASAEATVGGKVEKRERKEDDVTEKEKVQAKVEMGSKKRVRATVEDAENEEPTSKKKSSKKKKKAKKGNTAEPEPPAAGEVVETSASKKPKTKMNKKSGSSPAQEEVITISLASQQQAKKATVATEKSDDNKEEAIPGKKKKNKRKETEAEKEARRVSFGKVNHSKSHKASMKALRTMPSPKLMSVTPDKSILLKKSPGPVATSNSGGKAKAGRKKASDYF
jgi:hypothetical protein